MLLLTAFTPDMEDIGQLCVESLWRYCRDHGGISYGFHYIPGDYHSPPSWFKVDAIKRHLEDEDYVVWVDADALAIGTQDLRELVKPVTLNIASDVNGINCGIMAWKNCHESFKALERMEQSRETHRDHPWWEQAALMEFVDELDVFHQPKHIWNAYPDDRAPDSLFLHFPGQFRDGAIDSMKEILHGRSI